MTLKNKFFVLGVFVTLVLAGIVSFYASGDPDGLEKVATDKGFIENAQDHSLSDSPFADYGVSWISDDRVSVGISGVIGVLLMLGFSTLLFKYLAKRKQ